MVKKHQKPSTAADKKSNAQLSSTVNDSAQQIWLAGLGAFSKAQEEGGRVFEALVKKGMTIQSKTQAVAEEKIAEATSRVTHMTTDMGSKTQGQWDKLENIFEDRVAKALLKLGVPSARDLEALNARLDLLDKRSKEPLGGTAPAKPAGTAKTKTKAKDETEDEANPKAKTRNTPAKKAGPSKAADGFAAKATTKPAANAVLTEKTVTKKTSTQARTSKGTGAKT